MRKSIFCSPLLMLRRSLPQRASIRGTSAFSSGAPGLCSGEDGLCPWLRSKGGLLLLLDGGGEMEGLTEVGLLAADDEVVDRSRMLTFEPIGELRESFLMRTGEEVREGMERGGGDENFRHSLGDLSFTWSPLRLFWLVAKKSSRDLSCGKNIER